MAERTEELRDKIDQNRGDIGYTVDQLQNRVSPGRVTARGRYRMRRWWIDTRDRVMGNDEPAYPWESPSQGIGQRVEAMGERASEIVSGAGETIANTPNVVRRQTRGNPLAAGFVAFGGGLLVGTLLPESQAESRAAQRLEPALSGMAEEAREIGKDVAEDIKTSAGEAMEEVKDTASTAAEEVKDEAREAMNRAREGNEV